MTETSGVEPSARELGYDQTDEPAEATNAAPKAQPTIESVERAAEEASLDEKH